MISGSRRSQGKPRRIGGKIFDLQRSCHAQSGLPSILRANRPGQAKRLFCVIVSRRGGGAVRGSARGSAVPLAPTDTHDLPTETSRQYNTRSAETVPELAKTVKNRIKTGKNRQKLGKKRCVLLTTTKNLVIIDSTRMFMGGKQMILENRQVHAYRAALNAAFTAAAAPQKVRRRQNDWDAANIRTESTRLPIAEDDRLRRLCARMHVTRYQLIGYMLRTWMDAVDYRGKIEEEGFTGERERKGARTNRDPNRSGTNYA